MVGTNSARFDRLHYQSPLYEFGRDCIRHSRDRQPPIPPNMKSSTAQSIGTMAAIVAVAGLATLISAAATGCAPCSKCSDYDNCEYAASTTDGICWLRFFADGRPITKYDRRPIGGTPCETTEPVQCFIHEGDIYWGRNSDQRPFHEQCPKRVIAGSALTGIGAIVCIIYCTASHGPLNQGPGRRRRPPAQARLCDVYDQIHVSKGQMCSSWGRYYNWC